MTSLNLKAIDPAELMPLPEVPESYGPRNEEEKRVHALVKEALDSGPGKTYASVSDLVAELRAGIPRLGT
ncbi:hypothetical protein [Janthinobacterium fluminis]|uniref:Uncharacterized protein n=1 Tax=Janthinobacterium fluminis TaxID=2987524 RepID=A0ABT5K0Q1_9BURK|nr:hypothetical protein [Janthinobacterium fluminis]MDC8758429.1 hypothetical protein [Janthinobacterium fluminis]